MGGGLDVTMDQGNKKVAVGGVAVAGKLLNLFTIACKQRLISKKLCSTVTMKLIIICSEKFARPRES